MPNDPVREPGASPRPWRRNPLWPRSGWTADSFAILDADGNDVLPVFRWLDVTEADLDLIVAAVNAYGEETMSKPGTPDVLDGKVQAAIDKLAERLHWKLEHVDPRGSPDWSSLSDHQRAIFRTAVSALLDEQQLVYAAMGRLDDLEQRLFAAPVQR